MEQSTMELNADDLPDIICAECGAVHWEQIFRMKKISAIISPEGKESISPMQIFACTKCGLELTDSLERDVANEQSTLTT